MTLWTYPHSVRLRAVPVENQILQYMTQTHIGLHYPYNVHTTHLHFGTTYIFAMYSSLSLLFGKPHNIAIFWLSCYQAHEKRIEANGAATYRTISLSLWRHLEQLRPTLMHIYYAVTTCYSKIKRHPVNSAVQQFFLFDDRLIQIHVQYQNNHLARLACCLKPLLLPAATVISSPRMLTIPSWASQLEMRQAFVHVAPNRNTNNIHMGGRVVNKNRVGSGFPLSLQTTVTTVITVFF